LKKPARAPRPASVVALDFLKTELAPSPARWRATARTTIACALGALLIVSLYLPDDAKADLTATWTNGGVSYSDVKLDVTEKSRRRLEARMNGGGTPIELHTTNGGIRIRNRSDAPSNTDTDDDKNDHDGDVKAPKPPKPPAPPSGERR